MDASFRQAMSPGRPPRTSGCMSSLSTFKSTLGSPSQPIETLASRQADWDRSEKAQNQLFEYQWKVIEGQVGQTAALAEGLSTLQREMVNLKELVTGKFDEHHSIFNDLHQQARAYSEGHHATAIERLEFVERLLGESADKHAKEIADAHSKLANFHGTAAEQQQLLKKMVSLEHHASMEDRIRYIEKLLGDSIDKHTKEIDEINKRYKEAMNHSQAAHSKVQDLHGTFSEKLNSLGMSAQRLDHFEKRLVDQQNRHEKHAEEVTKRHQGVQDAFARLNEQHNNLKMEHKAALQEHHASVQERLKYIEKVIGDSADKHEKMVAEAHRRLQESHSKLQEQVQDAHGRLRDAYGQMQDMQSKIQDAHGKVADLHGHMQDAHSRLGDLSGHVHGTSKEIHASMEQRISFLEKCMGDSADKHARAEELMQAQNARFNEHVQRLDELCGHHQMESKSRMDSHAKLEDRLRSVEEQSTLKERIEYLEQVLNDSADRHKEELVHLQLSLTDLHGQVKNAHELREEKHMTLEQRVEFLEAKVCDSEGKFSGHLAVATTVVAEQEEVTARVNAIAKEMRELEQANYRSEQSLHSRVTGSTPSTSPNLIQSANSVSKVHSSPWKDLGATAASGKDSGSLGSRREMSTSSLNTGMSSTSRLGVQDLRERMLRLQSPGM